MPRPSSFGSAALIGVLALLACGSQSRVHAQGYVSPQARYLQQLNYQRWLQQMHAEQIMAQQQMAQMQAQAQFQQAVLQPPPQLPAQLPFVSPNLSSQGSASTQVWEGDETLSGYGSLTFRLSTDGRATMIDARDTSDGSWSRSGNVVTLRFPGNIAYTGTIRGRAISGTATNGRASWTFSVERN